MPSRFHPYPGNVRIPYPGSTVASEHSNRGRADSRAMDADENLNGSAVSSVKAPGPRFQPYPGGTRIPYPTSTVVIEHSNRDGDEPVDADEDLNGSAVSGVSAARGHDPALPPPDRSTAAIEELQSEVSMLKNRASEVPAAVSDVQSQVAQVVPQQQHTPQQVAAPVQGLQAGHDDPTQLGEGDAMSATGVQSDANASTVAAGKASTVAPSVVEAGTQQYLFGRKMTVEESDEHIRKLRAQEYLNDHPPVPAPLSQVSTIVQGDDPTLRFGKLLPEAKWQKMTEHLHRDFPARPYTLEQPAAGTAMSETSVAAHGTAMSHTDVAPEVAIGEIF